MAVLQAHVAKLWRTADLCDPIVQPLVLDVDSVVCFFGHALYVILGHLK